MDLNPIILAVSAVGAAAGVAAYVEQLRHRPKVVPLFKFQRDPIVINNRVEVETEIHNGGTQAMIAPTLRHSDGVVLRRFGDFGTLLPGEQLTGLIEFQHPSAGRGFYVEFSWLETRGQKRVEMVRRITLPDLAIQKPKGSKWKTVLGSDLH